MNLKHVLVGLLLVGVLGYASYLGVKKLNTKVTPTPVLPVPTVPGKDLDTPVDPTPPAPPVPPSPVDPKQYTKSFIHGYHDGYSGRWLAPAQWMVVQEYRAGHHAGVEDKKAGKPNMFLPKE